MTFSKIKILQVFSSSKEALEFENKILTRVNARKNPKFLNQQNGGDGDVTLKQHTEKTKEKMSKSHKEFYKTERGIKTKENHSEFMTERFNPETEEGQKNLENTKLLRQKGVKTQIQNRKDASILGELMFDEAFIKENFLITDDKHNQRFLWSVYSKLSGYSKSQIRKEKREGKLSFLYGIKSISLTEELENSKIKEIEAIIKSRNEELSLKAS